MMHFAADSMDLSSLKFYGELRKTFISARVSFRQFKVIQGFSRLYSIISQKEVHLKLDLLVCETLDAR